MRLAGRVRHALSDLPAEQHAALRLRQGATRRERFERGENARPVLEGSPDDPPFRAAAPTDAPSPAISKHQGDHRCEARTCYETPSKHCWRKEEQRAAAACKPPVAEGPSIGFVHLFGADPNYEQNMKAINNEYSVEGLPVKIKDRVKTAIKAFDKYTQRRPIVVVVDVAYWWAGKNLGWWRSWKKDLGTYDKFAGKLNEYKKDMAALVKLLDKEMEKSGRPYVLVGKSNHNRGFEEGTVEFNFIRAMGKAVKAVFEQHGHHFYDWRDVADQAEAKGRWVMVDKLHQGSESNDLQTRAFMKWTEAELGKKFSVSLEKQNEKLAEMEAERAKEQEQEEAEMRRERRRQKREEERAAQKAKDDAEWEAAEEERRQQAAQEAAAKEEEDKQALVKAEEEAMSTLTNIRGYLNTNIANIVGPQRAAAGALGSMDVNIPQRQPSAGQTR